MAFRGWPVEAIEFYEGLEADNSKAYWQRHKDVYEQHVRAPMESLLEELRPEFGEARIFRPYRDVRFSADKSPYKTHIGATIGSGYVQLGPDGLAAGFGMWEMAPDQLERYRAAVDDDGSGPELVAVVAAARAGGHEVMSRGALKTAPRGYPKDHPDRTPPLQGHRRMALLGRRCVARHRESEVQGRDVPPRRAAARCVAGSSRGRPTDLEEPEQLGRGSPVPDRHAPVDRHGDDLG
ncbi:MAG: DUF2461 domain-containing protein [Actinomycetota bacterium]